MSDTQVPPSENVVATQPAQEQASKKKRPVFVPPKVQKQLDAMKVKHDKLIADNKALKKQLADLKSSHSRIRRIPKAPVPAAPASTPAAE